jgi:hypothetical protein
VSLWSRRTLIAAGVVLLAAAVAATVLYRSSDDPGPADLTVGWGGSEGHPSCVYDPGDQTVGCTLTIEGSAPRADTVTVTVTAYADENTSEPVGSETRSVKVEGAVDQRLLVTIAVAKAPHIDEDGETACRLSVDY